MMPKDDKPSTDKLAETYNKWYAESPHWEDAPGKTVILNALPACVSPDQSLRLLDIACGTGSFLARIHDTVSAQWDLHGIDFSEAAIDRARQIYPDFAFLCGDATHLAYEDGFFDIITCYGSWEHFSDPAAAIREAARVLKPGGWVLAMMPTLGIHRTDRLDEGWYEDTEVEGYEKRQLQWNLLRSTWVAKFAEAGIQLVSDSLAVTCGARKPGVFYFGIRLNHVPENKAEAATEENLLALSLLANQTAYQLAAPVKSAAEIITNSLLENGKVLVCGNGGSAADAQHFVAELVGRMSIERRALPAISLSSDPSVVTALSNDYGYTQLFARQVAALGQAGDVLIMISTSGRSANVIEALKVAADQQMGTIAVLGQAGDPVFEDCDVTIHVPSANTQRVQEIHSAVLHAICEQVEQAVAQSS